MIWELPPRQQRILRWVGYPVFYLLCLLVFVYITFPLDRVKNRAIAEFNAAQAEASGMRLEIDELSWYWFTGLEAEGVRLISASPPPAEDGKLVAPQRFQIDAAHVHYSMLSALTGSRHISFGVEANGGEVVGHVADDDGVRTVAMEFVGLGISGLPFLADAVGLPMSGALTGTVELHLPEQQLAKGEGKIELQATELSVGDGKAKIRDTIALPQLNAGALEFSAKAAEGHVKIEKFAVRGPDLELESEGTIRLRDPFGTSRSDLSLRFKFSDQYKTKNDMTKGLFGEPGSKVPGLFDLDPKIKRAKGSDGFYSWRMSGPFAKLNFQPKRGSGRAKKSSGRSRSRARRPRASPKRSPAVKR